MRTPVLHAKIMFLHVHNLFLKIESTERIWTYFIPTYLMYKPGEYSGGTPVLQAKIMFLHVHNLFLKIESTERIWTYFIPTYLMYKPGEYSGGIITKKG